MWPTWSRSKQPLARTIRLPEARSRSASAAASSTVSTGSRRTGAEGLGQLRARHGGRAALHDDEAARDVGEGGRLNWGAAGGERHSEGADHGVAGPRDVGDLVAAEDGDE